MPENPNPPPPPASPPPPMQPPPPPTSAASPPGSAESQARTWNMLCHLSALAGYVGLPAGNVLGPLLVWQIKKHEIPSVEVHGKASLNFQLTVLIGVLASCVAGALLAFICIGYLFFLFGGGLALCGAIFAVIAGLKANDGQEYQYPYSLNLIK